jgi:hypothetical protein
MFRVVCAASGLCLITALAGCTTAADAGNSFGDSGLINDIANRLTSASGESYTATYALANDGTATLAHNHDANTTAFHYPSGMVVLTAGSVISCDIVGKRSTCTTTTAGTGANALPPAIDDAIEVGGMIRPESVIARLAQTAVNADAILAESDRTVAGTDETCVSITGIAAANQFTACVTSDGLLGAFTGTVNGQTINMRLVDFTLTVDPASFNTP